MTTKAKLSLLFCGAACAGLGMLTCGPELSRVSELDNLRVLGVQKDKPYAKPGESVKLRMEWEDADGPEPRDVQLFWLGNCQNPPGEFYAGCAARWAEEFAPGASNEALEFKLCPAPGFVAPSGFGGAAGRGGAPGLGGDAGGSGGAPGGLGDVLCTDPSEPDETFTIEAAPLRPQSTDPAQPRSGVAYAFFGLCAGQVEAPQAWISRLQSGEVKTFAESLPRCFDADGKPLGGNDYVVGYSAVYSYEGFTNENPVVTGFQVAGETVDVDCLGSDLDAPVSGAPSCFTDTPAGVRYEPFALPDPEPTGCTEGVACIDACPDDGDPSCPEISLKPIVDRSSAELDTVANQIFGRANEESLWINDFVDRGSLKSDVKLLNDAVTGWNEQYQAQLYAPKEPGPMRIWAVVHDNRGGVNWVRIPAFVR